MTPEQLADRLDLLQDGALSLEFDAELITDSIAMLRSLAAENAALRADAERYRWLEQQAGTLDVAAFSIYGEFNPMTNFLKDAIDAAMKDKP